jgi:hypothetical protein
MTDDLHRSTHLRAAAWVPNDDPARSWDQAIDLAARWLWERSEAEGLPPMSVSNTKSAAGMGHGTSPTSSAQVGTRHRRAALDMTTARSWPSCPMSSLCTSRWI